ncbi:MAG: hypothetical protein FD163_2507 [Hyphomonadaceae bacterium]|nr:MAG: hypothetical protein FD163_2507 [Hyphomonadaceae bacterium]
MLPKAQIRKRAERASKSECPCCHTVGEHFDTRKLKSYRVLYFRCRNFKCNARWTDKQELLEIIQNRKLVSPTINIVELADTLARD